MRDEARPLPPTPSPRGGGGGSPEPAPPPGPPLASAGGGGGNTSGSSTPSAGRGAGSAPPPPGGKGLGGGVWRLRPQPAGPRHPMRNIVRNQPVDGAKVVRCRELRRDMTPAERLLWARLRRNQLDGFYFRRQQIIDGFIADFYCHQAGVVVELDGPVHDDQLGYDAERDRIIAARGLVVLRFQNDEVFADTGGLLARLAAACRARVTEDPSPRPPPPGGEGETGQPPSSSPSPSRGGGRGEGSLRGPRR